MSPRVPAFLSFHIEPDAYQLGPSGPATWNGYDALTDLVARLRPMLGEKSGAARRPIARPGRERAPRSSTSRHIRLPNGWSSWIP